MLDFIDLKTALIIVHLFGLAIGAGGAFMSDAMFLHAIRDQKISQTEMGFLSLGSFMVWAGLILLIGSGIGIFFTNPEGYLASSKFLSKMTVVGIIVINGIVFHLWHIPRIKRHVDRRLPSSKEFTHNRVWLLTGGAISVTSWVSALIFGALKSIPYSYAEIILVYLVLVSIAIIIANLAKNYILPTQST